MKKMKRSAKSLGTKKPARKFKLPLRASQVPVTQAMLFEVRDELKADIRAMDARFNGVDARFASIDARFDDVDARFASIDARFDAIDARFASIDARFDDVDARFASIDARFDAIDARFASVDAKFDAIDARFDKLDAKFTAEFHKLALLIEEQNARNKFVLDGLTALFDRQERLENHVYKQNL